MEQVELSWPLPAGHRFGPKSGNITWHDGRGSLAEHQALKRWQETYRSRFWHNFPVTGVYDAPTQAAVVAIQRLTGLPPDGLLGPDVWEAVRTAERPPRPKPPAPAPLKPGPPAGSGRKRALYWRRMSRYGVKYGQDPEAPPWWPGRPFGANERGFHVRELQELLGLKPTGFYNANTVRRVRGLQQLHDLPVSGICDLTLARLVDPPPWPMVEAAS